MLSKNKRVPRKLFSLFISGSKVFKSDIFLLRIAKNTANGSRFSFSVSKKVAKKAADRNKLRRLGYKFIEKYINSINGDFLVNFSFKKVPKDTESVDDQIYSLLNQSKLIK